MPDDKLTKAVEANLNAAVRQSGLQLRPRSDSPRQPPLSTTWNRLKTPRVPARTEKFLPGQLDLFA